MTETQMTEAPHNIRKTALEYIALASIAVLSLVIYLWLGFSSPPKEEVRESPWDFRLTSVNVLDEDDLAAIRTLNAVDRIEQNGTELLLWMTGTAADRAAYEQAAAAAEGEITALADEREAARVEKLLREYHTEPDPDALAELAAMQEKLDAEAKRLADFRNKLDGEQDTLRKQKTQLDAVRIGLNEEGHLLDEAEASISADSGNVNRDELRQHSEKRDAWFAGGEDYLDTFTVFEQEKTRLEEAERVYSADLYAWNTENERLEKLRKELETVPEPPEIQDCTWLIERNSLAAEAFDTPVEKPFSPLRLAMQMLFLGVAALTVWFFFARLLSSVAASITKPRSAPEYSVSDEESVFTDETEAAASTTEQS